MGCGAPADADRRPRRRSGSCRRRRGRRLLGASTRVGRASVGARPAIGRARLGERIPADAGSCSVRRISAWLRSSPATSRARSARTTASITTSQHLARATDLPRSRARRSAAILRRRRFVTARRVRRHGRHRQRERAGARPRARSPTTAPPPSTYTEYGELSRRLATPRSIKTPYGRLDRRRSSSGRSRQAQPGCRRHLRRSDRRQVVPRDRGSETPLGERERIGRGRGRRSAIGAVRASRRDGSARGPGSASGSVRHDRDVAPTARSRSGSSSTVTDPTSWSVRRIAAWLRSSLREDDQQRRPRAAGAPPTPSATPGPSRAAARGVVATRTRLVLGGVEGAGRGRRGGRRRSRARPTGGRAPGRPRAASPPPTRGSSGPGARSATRPRRATRPA